MTGNELANKVLADPNALHAADALMEHLDMVIKALRAYDYIALKADELDRLKAELETCRAVTKLCCEKKPSDKSSAAGERT